MQVPKMHMWQRGSKRKPNYWVRYTVNGHEEREPTGAKTLAEYRDFVERLERDFRLGEWRSPRERKGSGGGSGRLTYAQWAPMALAHRSAAGLLATKTTEDSHVRNHLIPMFGALYLDEITYAVVLKKFAGLRDGTEGGVRDDEGNVIRKLSPRMVNNVHTTFHAHMKLAARLEKIANPPPPLSAVNGDLPLIEDAGGDDWRAEAVFVREEVSTLLSCVGLDAQSLTYYATAFLTGGRFAELSKIRVRDYDAFRKPLASLTIPAVKTGRRARTKGKRYRIVPVHPELRIWLQWWLREGFEATHGRAPRPDDLLFPTQSPKRQKLGLEHMSHSEVYKRWKRHLVTAGLRPRRLHDARRTFISIFRASASSGDIVRTFTHRSTGDRVLDDYTSYEWEALCRQITATEWSLPRPPTMTGDVIVLPIAHR